MTTTKVYRTIREARNALALDTGFDPFLSGGWGRCTKAKLAAAGYPVDPAEWRRQRDQQERWEAQGKCRECGEPAETKIFCDAHHRGGCHQCPSERTGLCHKHTKHAYTCDNGHRWEATDSEDAANGHKCPRCGEYWV